MTQSDKKDRQITLPIFSPTRQAWIEVMKLTGASLGTLVAASSLFFFVGEPHAENWLSNQLKIRKFATQAEVGVIKRNIDRNTGIASEVRDRTLRLEARQETMLNSQARTQQLLETLLLELRRQNP